MSTIVANHHASHPGFAGPFGLLAALSMIWGRGGDARLASTLADLRGDDDVVDVGCGPGAAARHAATTAASVIGVDPAPVMLRVARLLSRRVRFVEGSAEELPLPDASASVLWSLASVHHWRDVDAGLDEARRVLRPEGRLVAIEHLADPAARGLRSHGWAPEQAEAFADCCTAHGFTDVVVSRHDTGRRPALAVRAHRPAAGAAPVRPTAAPRR